MVAQLAGPVELALGEDGAEDEDRGKHEELAVGAHRDQAPAQPGPAAHVGPALAQLVEEALPVAAAPGAPAA